MNLEREDSMKEIEKLNAIATMTIRAYQKKTQRLKMIIGGLLILYAITIAFFSYLNICTEKKEAAFAVSSPLCISLVCRAVAKHERTVVV